ncbi:hypothetical protein BJX61DRAFT_543591 [Aspergillus egyptiacus]|nr:hypothetical protein BJX61DRAFT_543591 [Aspergillus egyptiacus]
MGQKVTAVTGVRSENFTQPGNAINEIWAGNTEIISRLPFGDSDMAQAGWPENGMPKIPWHNFIIPMKRSLDTTTSNFTTVDNTTMQSADSLARRRLLNEVANKLFQQDPLIYLPAMIITIAAMATVELTRRIRYRSPSFSPRTTYAPEDVQHLAFRARLAIWTFVTGMAIWMLAGMAWMSLHELLGCNGPLMCQATEFVIALHAIFDAFSGAWCVRTLWGDLQSVHRVVDLERNIYRSNGELSEKTPLVA